MRTNKASEKDPANGEAIRFKVDGNWYEGTFDGTDYIFPNGTRNAKATVDSWHRIKPVAVGLGGGIGEDADAAPVKREPRKEPKRDLGGFDLPKPDATDGDGWAIYNAVRTIYGLEPLPVPPGATVNSLTA
jgi:hypothetical protein